jgi:hypothetical protein
MAPSGRDSGRRRAIPSTCGAAPPRSGGYRPRREAGRRWPTGKNPPVSCLLTVVAGPPCVLDGSQLGRLAGRDLAADPEGLGHQLPGTGQTVFILEFLEDPDGALGLRLAVGRPLRRSLAQDAATSHSGVDMPIEKIHRRDRLGEGCGAGPRRRGRPARLPDAAGGGPPAPGRGVDRRRCSSRRHQPVQPPAAPVRGTGSGTVPWRMLSS